MGDERALGAACIFEGDEAPFPDLGFTLAVLRLPRPQLALRHGAGVEGETTSPAEAYAPFPKWQPGPPDDWSGLPCA